MTRVKDRTTPTECAEHGGFPPISCPPCVARRSSPTGLAVAQAARSLVGIRYVIGGRSLRGVDCLGACVVARQMALVPGGFDGPYSDRLDGIDVIGEVMARGGRLDVESAGAGDVIGFSIGGSLRHFAVLLDDGHMLTATRGAGRAQIVKLDGRWASRAVVRIPAAVGDE